MSKSAESLWSCDFRFSSGCVEPPDVTRDWTMFVRLKDFLQNGLSIIINFDIKRKFPGTQKATVVVSVNSCKHFIWKSCCVSETVLQTSGVKTSVWRCWSGSAACCRTETTWSTKPQSRTSTGKKSVSAISPETCVARSGRRCRQRYENKYGRWFGSPVKTVLTSTSPNSLKGRWVKKTSNFWVSCWFQSILDILLKGFNVDSKFLFQIKGFQVFLSANSDSQIFVRSFYHVDLIFT